MYVRLFGGKLKIIFDVVIWVVLCLSSLRNVILCKEY